MSKLGNGTRLEPKTLLENHGPGGRETARRPRGVLSGIVLGAWESHVHGEGPDGSTQPVKETRAGHVGLEPHGPTSLRGIANHATLVVWRGSEYNRGTGGGKTARPGLCGGCRVTGIPTAEAIKEERFGITLFTDGNLRCRMGP